METLVLYDEAKLKVTLLRLCHELFENYQNFENCALIGVQPRGTYLANRLFQLINDLMPENALLVGEIDVTFHRDDFRRKSHPIIANQTKIDFSIEDKRVILVDDVLFTGRTVRAALDAILSYGRPKKVDLLVLVDRSGTRDVPIQPHFTGIQVNTSENQRIIVEFAEQKGKDSIRLEEIIRNE